MAKRKTRRLTTIEAVGRIETMMAHVDREVHIMIEELAALETGNDVVVESLRGVHFYGANCYTTLSRTLSHSLALRLAKMMERPPAQPGRTVADRWNKSDVVSLPLLLRLLDQKRCRRVFAGRARKWIGSEKDVDACLKTIDAAVREYRAFRMSADGRAALSKLDEFRNHILAHNLLTQSDAHLPRYNQLFVTYAMVKRVWEHVGLAVEGTGRSVDELEAEFRRIGEAFWRPALSAASKD